MTLTRYYLHKDTIDTYNPNWMRDICDDVLLSQISIPGTHETMATKGWSGSGEIGKCQTLSLLAQLHAGIRYIDIRCNYEPSKKDGKISEPSFSIHHGVINENMAFGDNVLSPVVSFLEENPSETILMRIKQEYSSVSDTTFSNTFQKYVDQYKSYFWEKGPKDTLKIPRLKSTRGKIVVLYDIGDHKFGLPYSDTSLFCTQDNYHFSTNWHQYTKWEEVKTHLTQADEQYKSNEEQNNIPKSAVFLNYLSGSGGSYPFFVASGHVDAGTNGDRLWTGLTTLTSKHKWPDFPRLNHFLGLYSIYFEGINNLCGDCLQNYRYVGIVAADFPGAGLIEEIIQINKTHSPQILRVDPPDTIPISKKFEVNTKSRKNIWNLQNDTDYNRNPNAISIELENFDSNVVMPVLYFSKEGNDIFKVSIPYDLVTHRILSFEFDSIDVELPENLGPFDSLVHGSITATVYFSPPPWNRTSLTDTTFISETFNLSGSKEVWFNPVITSAKELYVIGTTRKSFNYSVYKDGNPISHGEVSTPWNWDGKTDIPFIVYVNEEFDEFFIDNAGTLSFNGQISYTSNNLSKSVFVSPMSFVKDKVPITTTLWKSPAGELGLFATINGGVGPSNVAFTFLKSGKVVNSFTESASVTQVLTSNSTPVHIPGGFDEIQLKILTQNTWIQEYFISGRVFLDVEDMFNIPDGAQYIQQNYKTSQTQIIWKTPSVSVKGNSAYFFVENTNQVPIELQFIQNSKVIYSVKQVTEETKITITPEAIPTGFDEVQISSPNKEAMGLIVGSVEVLSPSQNTVNETKIENSLSLSEKSKAIFYTSKELEQITALTQKLFISVKEDILADDVTDYQINQVALKIDGLSAENFPVEKYQLEGKIKQAKRLSQRRNLLQYGNFESAEPWIFSSHATILDSNDLFPHSFLTLTSTLTPDKNPTYAYQQIPKNRLKPYTRYTVRGFIAECTKLDILLSCDSTIIKQQLNVPAAKVQQISIENGNCCAQAENCTYADGTVTDSHWFTYTIETGSLQQNSDVGLELCFKLTTEKGNAQIGNVEIIEERLLTEKEKQKKQQKEKKWVKQKQIKMREMRKTLDIMHEDIASLYDMKMNLKLDVSHQDIQNVHIPHANSLEGVYLSMVPDQPGPYYEEYQLLASLKRYARRVYRNRNKISNGTFQYNLLDWKPTGNVDVQIEKKQSVLQLLDSGAMVSQLVQLPIENVTGEEISYLLRIHAQGNGKVTILHGEEITVLPFTNSDEQVQMIEWYPSTNEVQLEISSKSGKVTVSSIEILENPDVE